VVLLASYDDAVSPSVESYVAALDEGAEALECDVRLTADGHLVCVHDRHLRRLGKVASLEAETINR